METAVSGGALIRFPIFYSGVLPNNKDSWGVFTQAAKILSPAELIARITA